MRREIIPTRSAALSKTGRHFSFLVGDCAALHGAMPVPQYEYSSIEVAILEYLWGDTGVLSLRQVSQYCVACPDIT